MDKGGYFLERPAGDTSTVRLFLLFLTKKIIHLLTKNARLSGHLGTERCRYFHSWREELSSRKHEMTWLLGYSEHRDRRLASDLALRRDQLWRREYTEEDSGAQLRIRPHPAMGCGQRLGEEVHRRQQRAPLQKTTFEGCSPRELQASVYAERGVSPTPAHQN